MKGQRSHPQTLSKLLPKSAQSTGAMKLRDSLSPMSLYLSSPSNPSPGYWRSDLSPTGNSLITDKIMAFTAHHPEKQITPVRASNG
jgi:hypothetical protein